MQRPLLVIDGDSFAHRAYHGLPKTILRHGDKGAGAILGFANFLLRLYEAERPRAVLVAWDTLDVPNYRHKAFPAYQSGRDFDDALVVEVEARDGPIGLWCRRFLSDRQHASIGAKFDHAVTLGIAHLVAEHRRARHARRCPAKHIGQSVTVEDVVAENEGRTAAHHEVGSYDVGLGEAGGRRLLGI